MSRITTSSTNSLISWAYKEPLLDDVVEGSVVAEAIIKNVDRHIDLAVCGDEGEILIMIVQDGTP